MASWGRCLEPLEKMESHVLLELKALHEGAWKMGEFMAFSQQLGYAGHTRAVGLVEGRAEGTSGAPVQCLSMSSSTSLHGPLEVHLCTCLKSWTSQAAPRASGRMSRTTWLTWFLHCTESALGKVSLPPKACFAMGQGGACIV